VKFLDKVTGCRVCRLWNKITKKLRESRHQIAWLLYSDPKDGSIESQIAVHLEVLTDQLL